MKTWFVQWLKKNSVMLINAGSLVGTTAVTSALGFVYWWLAAKRFLPEDVGIASASVSAMMLLGSLCVLGLGTLLITELPRQPGQETSLISTALVVVGSAGAVVGMLFALIAPFLSADFNPLRASLVTVMEFAAGVSLTSITLVLDQACIGLLRGGLQLWRNTVFAVAKLVVLIVVSMWAKHALGMTIYATWAAGNALSFIVFVLFVGAKRSRWQRSYRWRWSLLRKLGFAAIQHHLLNLALQAPTLILPLLVTALLSAKMNAWFYVSWMIASFVFVVPTALTTVLHATNAAQQSTLSHKARVTIGLSLLTSVVVNVLLQLDTRQVLSLFGGMYADQATASLRILALAAFPLIVKNHYISICRIQDRILRAMVGMVPGGAFELVAAIIGAHLGGLTGLSLGWIIANYIEAVCMFPAVYKVLRAKVPSLDLLTEEDYAGSEAVWLLDTLVLPAISTNHALPAIPKQPRPVHTSGPEQRVHVHKKNVPFQPGDAVPWPGRAEISPATFPPSLRPAAGEAERGGARGRSPRAGGMGMSLDTFPPSLWPAAGETERGGARGRSPRAGGMRMPFDTFPPSLRPAAGETERGSAGGRSPMVGGMRMPLDTFPPSFRPAASETEREGVPGDAVPWPGELGCPPPNFLPPFGPPQAGHEESLKREK